MSASHVAAWRHFARAVIYEYEIVHAMDALHISATRNAGYACRAVGIVLDLNIF